MNDNFRAGAPIKPGGRQESILSSSPFTDSTVKLEMKNADERCAVLAKDIEQLKLEIAELSKVMLLRDIDSFETYFHHGFPIFVL